MSQKVRAEGAPKPKPLLLLPALLEVTALLEVIVPLPLPLLETLLASGERGEVAEDAARGESELDGTGLLPLPLRSISESDERLGSCSSCAGCCAERFEVSERLRSRPSFRLHERPERGDATGSGSVSMYGRSESWDAAAASTLVASLASVVRLSDDDEAGDENEMEAVVSLGVAAVDDNAAARDASGRAELNDEAGGGVTLVALLLGGNESRCVRASDCCCCCCGGGRRCGVRAACVAGNDGLRNADGAEGAARPVELLLLLLVVVVVAAGNDAVVPSGGGGSCCSGAGAVPTTPVVVTTQPVPTAYEVGASSQPSARKQRHEPTTRSVAAAHTLPAPTATPIYNEQQQQRLHERAARERERAREHENERARERARTVSRVRRRGAEHTRGSGVDR